MPEAAPARDVRQATPFRDDRGQAVRIRADLDAAGTPNGPNGLAIAAHAHVARATPVTASVGEFARARGLRIETWLA